MQLSFRRYNCIEGTDKGDTDASIVETKGMSTNVVPASTDVRKTVASDEEVVTDVRPLSGLDMESLSKPHMERAIRLRLAEVGGGVTDDHIGYW